MDTNNHLEKMGQHRETNMALFASQAKMLWAAIKLLPETDNRKADSAIKLIWECFNGMASLLGEALESLGEDADYQMSLRARIAALETEVGWMSEALDRVNGQETKLTDDAEDYAYSVITDQIARTLDIKGDTGDILLQLITGSQLLTADDRRSLREWIIAVKKAGQNVAV